VFTPDPVAEEWFRLGKFARVCQAETFQALKGILQLFPTVSVGKKAVIFSDSEAMIKALMSPVITSKLV